MDNENRKGLFLQQDEDLLPSSFPPALYTARLNSGFKKSQIATKRANTEEFLEYNISQPSTSNILTPVMPLHQNIEYDPFQQKVLQELSFLRDKITSIENKLSVKKAKRTHLYEAPDGMPMETVEDFENFEKDEGNRHESVQEYLEYLGGVSVRDALHGFVRATMTAELARKYTWFGKKEDGVRTCSLYKTKLMRIFFDALQKKWQVKLDEFVQNINEVLRSYKQTCKGKSIHSTGNRQQRQKEMENHFKI